MTVADILIYGSVFALAIALMWSGFVGQITSLFVLAAAVWSSVHFADQVGELFVNYLHTEWVRKLSGGAIVFLLVWAIGFWLIRVLSGVLDMAGLRWLDKFLGLLLGVVISFILVWMTLAAVVVAPFFNPPLQERSWWRHSHAISFVLSRGKRVIELLEVSSQPPAESGSEKVSAPPAVVEPEPNKPAGKTVINTPTDSTSD